MRVLLTESESGAGARVEAQLHAAGYDVELCHDSGASDDECVVTAGPGGCPLHGELVDIFIDVRATAGAESTRERGAVCAVGNGVPLVVVGSADPARYPWSRAVSICAPDDVIEVCEAIMRPGIAAAGQAVEHAARRALLACEVDACPTVSIAESAVDVGVFVSVPVVLTDQALREVSAAVRLALSGRKGFPEDPRIVISGAD
ncbi:MAG: hypothetical protein HOW97_31915 [Catenulispora sp.]|nr:hypothetical protein [Catenulispora sp.]